MTTARIIELVRLSDYDNRCIRRSYHQNMGVVLIGSRKRRRMKSITASSEQQQGGEGKRLLVELVGAFNGISNSSSSSSSELQLVFDSLKLAIQILHHHPQVGARSPLTRAFSVALILAHLQMDAQVISAGILREALEAGSLSILDVRNRIGIGPAHLLHECFRLSNISSTVDVLDDETASALRNYCLSYYDARALILDLALKLDAMRHLDYLPRYQQQLLSLEALKIHVPLAHAIGITSLSLELEDLSFRYLFPCSYLYVDAWLRSHHESKPPLVDACRDHLLLSLKLDNLLGEMVDDISVKGRYKSRYSTMKKLLKDGRQPEDVNDILGLRVILKPIMSGPGDNNNNVLSEIGKKACYRAREIIRSLWKEIPKRSKDYIARPKANGYQSLHMAVDLSDDSRIQPLMEIQIRTADMDTAAGDGTASHSLYKGGLTDPEDAKRLRAIMMAAAELAAARLKELPPPANYDGIDGRNRVFHLLDKNGDGKISIEELIEVMEELGAQGEDALEMMQLLDSNSDGSLSSDEFDTFQKQVELMRNLGDKDDQYKTMLNEKLEVADKGSFIQLYRKELGESLPVS